MEQLNFDIKSASPSAISEKDSGNLPLAARLRPRSLADYAGQQHLLGHGRLLRRAIDADRFTSIILSGPPGTGKTSLAEIIALVTGAEFVRLSGVTSTVADIRREITIATQRREISRRKTILFIDEIHRFNRAQQDSLLPDVENGNIRLIGATTHNPQFYVIGALLSRSLVFALEPLSSNDITTLLRRALTDSQGFPEKKINIAEDALKFLAEICEGDARKALNALEIAVLTTPAADDGVISIDLPAAEESIQRKFINYDDDAHYDTASAFIKSMRGSDPDAAIYWLAKMLHAGEDIRFIARRIAIFASEDVGNADPRALPLAVNAMQAIEMIGMPEARIILAQAVTFCATAPKSNASYTAIDAAMEDVKKERIQPVPLNLRDPHSSSASKDSTLPGYKYPHDYAGSYVAQDYLGVNKSYYLPAGIGYEEKIKERMNYWKQFRTEGTRQNHA
jgi:putative ATPase